MAALADNGTARLWIDYVTGSSGIEHTLKVRPADGSQAGYEAAMNTLGVVFGLIGAVNFRQNWRVIRGRVAQQGSDISVVVPLVPALSNFVGTSTQTYSPDREAVQYGFIGRSPTTGRRVSMFLFGLRGTISLSTFRIVGGAAGDPLWVQNVANALNGSENTNIRTIDGSVATWYNYVNIQYNSYWERRIRIG